MPDLGNNIKCGNSLISHDFYENKDPDSITDELRRRINAFDWHAEFPEIFSGKTPGFNAIIGNPPYVRVHNIDYEIIDYLKVHFESAYKRIDISVCFLELAKNLLSSHGYTGVITSVQFFTTEYGERIREILANNKLECIVDFSGARVFQKATTYPGIIIFSKGSPSHFQVFTDIQIEPSGNLDQMLSFAQTHSVKCSSIRKGTWNFTNLKYESILKKLKSNTIPLEKVGKSHTGLFTGLNDVLLLTKEQINSLSLEKTIVRPIIMGKDPVRYGKPIPSRYVIYPYKDKQNKTKIVEESELKRHYPTCYKYLISKKPKLEKRMDSRKKICETRPWYSLTRFSTIEVIESPKILTPGEVRRSKFCLDLNKSAFYCARVFAITSKQLNLKFLLGILNSKVINIWLHTNCSLKQGGYYSYSANVLKKIPIPLIIFSNSKDKAHHDKMIKLVERMLDLHNKLAAAKIPAEKTRIQRQINNTDKQIDKLTYELYDLTEEEIKIVEEQEGESR